MNFLDECFRNKELDSLEFPIPSQELSFGLNIIFSFYLYYSSTKKILSLSILLTILGLFLSGFYLTMAAKVILNDTTCNDRPNSVSSHTFFSIFFFLIWNTNYLMKHKKQSKTHLILMIITDLSLILTTIHTYLGGFHSLRQMFYGFLFAIFYYFLYLLISKIFSKKNRLIFTFLISIISIIYSINYASILGFPIIIIVLTIIFTFLSISNLISFLRYTSQ